MIAESVENTGSCWLLNTLLTCFQMRILGYTKYDCEILQYTPKVCSIYTLSSFQQHIDSLRKKLYIFSIILLFSAVSHIFSWYSPVLLYSFWEFHVFSNLSCCMEKFLLNNDIFLGDVSELHVPVSWKYYSPVGYLCRRQWKIKKQCCSFILQCRSNY